MEPAVGALKRAFVLGVGVSWGASSCVVGPCGAVVLVLHFDGNFIVLPHWEIHTMPRYPIQTAYSDASLTSPCPILIMPSTWLGSDKYQLYKALV